MPDLASQLSEWKTRNDVGDKRLADLANDYAGISNLLSRSSIRNWSEGTSSRARDWRQIIAIAAALRLKPDEASDLLAAASCPDLLHLHRTVDGDDRHLLRYWERELGDSSDLATSPDATGLSADPSGASDRHMARTESRPTLTDSAPPRRRWMSAVVAAAAAAALVVGGFAFANRDEPDEVLDATETAETPRTEETAVQAITAVAAIRAPGEGATVGARPAITGTAQHPSGIAHVHMIIQQLDDAIYWNPDDQVWQDRFRVFIVRPTPDGEGNGGSNWLYRVDEDTPLPPGNYRARVWAAANDGNGDATGQLVNFVVAADTDLSNPNLATSIAMQAAAIPDERRQAERSGAEIPKVRIREPINGLHRAVGSVRIHAVAEYEPGLDRLEVQLRNTETDRYWNFDAEKWQATPFAMVQTEPLDPEDGNGKLRIDRWLPDGFAPPGTYEVTAIAFGVDGATFGQPERATVTILS